MKLAMVYWIVGCLIVGTGMGLRANRCPGEHTDNKDVLAAVATWPAGLGHYIAADRSTIDKAISCKPGN